MHPNHDNLITVSHFEVVLNATTPIVVGDLSWDGPCLILRRPLEKGGESLIADLIEASEIRVKLFGPANEAGEREVTHEWRVAHKGLRNRGLDFLHAARHQYAKESVALVDAELIQVNK